MADAEELKEAEERGFRRGRRIGRLEDAAFEPLPAVGAWLPESRLVFFRSWFFSFVTLQRRLITNLREIQRVRWLLAHEPDQVPSSARPFVEKLGLLERDHEAAFWEARFVTGELLDEGAGRACVVAALAATPQRPATTTEYDDLARYVKEDERRGTIYPTHVAIRPDAVFGMSGGWRTRSAAGRRRAGRSAGSAVPSRTPAKGSRTTPPFEAEVKEEDAAATHEVYAIESLDPSNPWAEDGRVWLLGKVRRRAAIEEALREMSLQAMRDRNSLVAAADAVAVAQRKESAGDPPTRRRL